MATPRPLAHVAIIPDGNRRWARAKGLAASTGHAAAVTRERLLAFLDESLHLRLTHLTIWAFSTENWKREKEEIAYLFTLVRDSIALLRKDAAERGVRFRWIGRRDRVPHDVREQLETFEQESASRENLTFVLALDYGGRDEIVRAVRAAIAQGAAVDEYGFARLLDTHDIPDPDLIIRTSGEQRLSGMFAYQGTYAELYFVEKHFPDFGPEDLREAARVYATRQRRYGG